MTDLLEHVIAVLVVLVPLCLVVLMVLAPVVLRWRTSHITVVSTLLFSLAWLCALALFLLAVVREPVTVSLFALPVNSGQVEPVGFLVDRVSASMLLLVITVSGVVHLWSLRAMREERHFRRYFFLLSLVTFEVTCVIVSNNLLMLGVFWIIKGVTLTFLLAHYHDRAASWKAALTKLRIDLLGDLALVLALVLIWLTFHTFEISSIRANLLHAPQSMVGFQGTMLTFLLLVAAMAKSAQWPFHAWLPGSVEAPTPVSALMHAGLINAGGFLLVRVSFLFLAAPVTPVLAIVIGSVTVFYGTLMMLTRNDVKGMLVYSTMGQMGFMILECGLGMFALALLHILVHGLFKAHAFLSSGAAIQQKTFTHLLAPHHSSEHTLSTPVLLLLSLLCVPVFFVVPFVTGEPLNTGGILLIFAWITTIHALARMPYWPSNPISRHTLVLFSLLGSILLYGIVISGVERFFAVDVAMAASSNHVLILAVCGVLLFSGLGSILLPLIVQPGWMNRLLTKLYVRALFSGYGR